MSEISHVVIVGGSGGLGRGAVLEHLSRGWRVTATVRNGNELDDLKSDQLSVVALDTLDWPAIERVGQALTAPIDRLFLIAGGTGPDRTMGDSDPETFAHIMMLNALSPLRIADRWQDRIAPDGTVVVMSSSLGSIAMNDNGGWEVYRMSKAALNMGLRSLAARRADKRTYIAINPGWVRTALGGPHADMSVEESVPKVVDVLDRHATDGGVQFLDVTDKALPW